MPNFVQQSRKISSGEKADQVTVRVYTHTATRSFIRTLEVHRLRIPLFTRNLKPLHKIISIKSLVRAHRPGARQFIRQLVNRLAGFFTTKHPPITGGYNSFIRTRPSFPQRLRAKPTFNKRLDRVLCISCFIGSQLLVVHTCRV